ncbi:arginase family protein [Streptomyces sp. MS1.HAVA.3]|uniref:Arginase family protein n=1 Tax=Streptomyces caledonius TaxID=3134107 RepID=A0ABU8U0M7_9ACTN
MREVAIIEAPSVLGLRPSGSRTSRRRCSKPVCRTTPGWCAPAGSTHRRTTHGGTRHRDPRSRRHRAVLRQAGRRGRRRARRRPLPLVLGGDCTVLLGNLLAVRRRGRYGLLFLDGHTDFYQPSAEPTGEAASMELALATGRGPRLLTDLEGRGPLLRDEDVVAFGFRDAAESREAGMQPLPPRLHAIDLDGVRAAGAATAAREAVGRLAHDDRAGFWVHLDVDVLDDAVMPAVDYRLPGGLTWQELESVLCTALADERAVGLDVTIFNPRLDPEGAAAARLTACLHRGLSARTGHPGRRAGPLGRADDGR